MGSLYISNNPDQFKILDLEPDERISKLKYRFSIDELDDYLFMKKIYSKLWKNKPISLKKVLNFLEENREVEILNKNINDSEINKKCKEKTLGNGIIPHLKHLNLIFLNYE